MTILKHLSDICSKQAAGLLVFLTQAKVTKYISSFFFFPAYPVFLA